VDLRRVIKRAAKWSVEWASAISGYGFVYRTSRTFVEGFRILTYHKIADHPQDSFTVMTDHFRSHMAFLADHHPVMALADLAQRLVEGPIPETGAVAVTFDDGYAEAATVISEILDKHRLPATFFVITGVLDDTIQFPGGPFLTWQNAREMSAAGLSIGSHAVSHRSLGEISLRDVEEELATSYRRITEELGAAPKGLSYPYGTVRDFSDAVAGIAKTIGYDYAVTGLHGLNHVGCNPYCLRRTSLTAGDGLRTFRMILKGHLDAWRLVDKWGYRLQRVEVRKRA
jgi:peptidoglycan/xylan/chitin deacetylase (PgdA/CDA1 family)